MSERGAMMLEGVVLLTPLSFLPRTIEGTYSSRRQHPWWEMALRLEHFKYHFALYLLLSDFFRDNGKRVNYIYAANLFVN